MTLGEHLEELRRRIIYALLGLVAAAAITLPLGNRLVDLLKYPFVQAMAETGREADLAVLSITAGFVTYLKVSLVAALVLAAPWVFYHLWMFVSAGLFPRERRYVVLAVPSSAVLFASGAVFFVLALATPMMKFFIFFNDWMSLQLVLTFDNHVDFMLTMALVFALAFQTPLIVLLLAKMGLLTSQSLRRYRRHVIIGILIACALLTPPDPFSQLCLALPMWLLFELGVLLVYLFVGRRRQPLHPPDSSLH